MRRRVAPAAVLLLAIVLAGCTGSSGGSDGAKEPTGDQKAWNAARKDPCRLLSADDVDEVIAGSKPKAIDDAPAGSCRYTLTDDREVQVDLYRPLSDAGLKRRTSGTNPADNGEALRLDTPGAAVIVHRDGAAALVAIRTANNEPDADVDDQADELAAIVRKALPTAPKPATALADRDLCDVVGPNVLGTGYVGGDARDPDTCAYRSDDGTLVAISLRKGTTAPGGLAKAWKPGGKGATWQPSGAESGGSGLALIPVEDGTVEVTLSSPELSDAKLEDVAAAVAKAVREADGD